MIINYWAVLVAGIVNMALGAFWYSPMGFGKPWMALMGYTPESMKGKKDGMGQKYLINFIGALVMAYVLARFVFAANAIDWQGGLHIGLWVWLGFIATTMLGSILWEGKKFKLYAINSGYYLVGLGLMGMILATWR